MREFASIEKLDEHLAAGGNLSGVVCQELDLRGHAEILRLFPVSGALFLGCRLSTEGLDAALEGGAVVFPHLDAFPFRAYRSELYRPEELFEGHRVGEIDGYESSLDGRIYAHYRANGGPQPVSIVESLARRLHDHAITDALGDVTADRNIVAIMGGHGVGRDETQYRDVAMISRALTRRGALLASGGGPGAMEATHLGAWLAGRDDGDLDAALQILARTPGFEPIGPWVDRALEVRDRFPRAPGDPESLGVPTWLYGHEPPTPFATFIAKYFANAVREEGLLSMATGGIVFSPGSAGTIQEIFQDAAQNHYVTQGVISPMVFFGVDYWTEHKPVYPLLRQLAEGHDYDELISITDDPQEIIDLLSDS